MKKKNFFSTLCMAFALALTVVSCGDDDPVPTPTPEPEPEPEQPTVTYNGYSYVLALDSIAGSEEAVKTFLTMLNDSISSFGLELKPLQAKGYEYVYGVSMTYNKDDAKEKAAYEALQEKCTSLKRCIGKYMPANNTSPVITTRFVHLVAHANGVAKDWSVNVGAGIGGSYGILSIPSLSHTTWKTKDAKKSGVESVSFGGWIADKLLKATATTPTLQINGEEIKDMTVLHQGAMVIVMNAEYKAKYGFTITSDGKQLVLIQKDGQAFEQDDVVYYDLEPAAPTE